MNDILGAMMDIAGEDISGEEAAAILGALMDSSEGEDLSGAAEAILGAPISAKTKAGRNLLAKAIAARTLAGSQVMRPRKPSSSGVQPIGFVQLGVLAGAQATIVAQPQTWFKPMRLVVPGTIAPFFTIDNIIVGNISQFPAQAAVPAETFIPEAQAVVMDLATVNPAMNLAIQATNISGVIQNFRASFVGKEVTP